jgi:heat shock protein HslJ
MDKNIMGTEKDFLNALKEAGSYTLENNVLKFFSKYDQSVLLSAKKEEK